MTPALDLAPFSSYLDVACFLSCVAWRVSCGRAGVRACGLRGLCVRTCADVRGRSRACTRQAGRDELAATERSELDVINSFLPALADEATTRKWVEDAIAESGASSPSMMGKVFVPLCSLVFCVGPCFSFYLSLLPFRRHPKHVRASPSPAPGERGVSV